MKVAGRQNTQTGNGKTNLIRLAGSSSVYDDTGLLIVIFPLRAMEQDAASSIPESNQVFRESQPANNAKHHGQRTLHVIRLPLWFTILVVTNLPNPSAAHAS